MFLIKYIIVAFVSIIIGTFSAANIVFPLFFGKNEKEAESGQNNSVNLIAPIIWIGIVYVTYLAMNKYFPENLTLAIIIYTISFLGTLSRGFKAYK